MSDFFYHRYQKKTNDQLLAIIENQDQYQDNAVNTAIQILNERNGSDIELIASPEIRRVQGKRFFDQIFNIDLLIKTFGFQDVLTWVTLALISISVLEILNYYSNEPSIEHSVQWIAISFLFLVTISNHIVFKSTHKCSNNVIGRITHDLAFLFLLISLRELYYYIISATGFFDADNFLGILLVALIFSFFLEFIVAILKRFFITVFKWQCL